MVLKSAKSANQAIRSTLATVSMARASLPKPLPVMLTSILSTHGALVAMIAPVVAPGAAMQATKQLVLVANLVS